MIAKSICKSNILGEARKGLNGIACLTVFVSADAEK